MTSVLVGATSDALVLAGPIVREKKRVGALRPRKTAKDEVEEEEEDVWVLHEVEVESLKMWQEEQENRHCTELHKKQVVTLSLMEARGAQAVTINDSPHKGVGESEVRGRAEVRTNAYVIVEVGEVIKALDVPHLRIMLPGSELAKLGGTESEMTKPLTKKDIKRTFRMRAVLDSRSEYSCRRARGASKHGRHGLRGRHAKGPPSKPIKKNKDSGGFITLSQGAHSRVYLRLLHQEA
ncbi:hypothetical protein ACLOJK_001094 [Asimina triloba]